MLKFNDHQNIHRPTTTTLPCHHSPQIILKCLRSASFRRRRPEADVLGALLGGGGGGEDPGDAEEVDEGSAQPAAILGDLPLQRAAGGRRLRRGVVHVVGLQAQHEAASSGALLAPAAKNSYPV
jgi:hypothetical protein